MVDFTLVRMTKIRLYITYFDKPQHPIICDVSSCTPFCVGYVLRNVICTVLYEQKCVCADLQPI